jgi:hypothetical protein
LCVKAFTHRIILPMLLNYDVRLEQLEVCLAQKRTIF